MIRRYRSAEWLPIYDVLPGFQRRKRRGNGRDSIITDFSSFDSLKEVLVRVLGNQLNDSHNHQLYTFTNGIDVDARLAKQEVTVQKAWLTALLNASYLTNDQFDQLAPVLDQALQQMQSGAFPWRESDEDIHMNLERFITEQVGELGKTIHHGRSRNDLIATTLRLFVANSMVELQQDAQCLIEAVCNKATETLDLIVPGMTHLQNGQPVRLAHLISSYGHALRDDMTRFETARRASLNTMPLGSAAFAGTTLQIDLQQLARELGFEHPAANSFYAVGDRGFILDALHAIAMTGVHLAKIAEDLIYWSSSNIGLITLPKDWSTGSSIMPNKRNPDVLELIRAKASRLVARDGEGKNIVKGFGNSYGSDLHELKKTLLSALDEVIPCLKLLTHMLGESSFKAEVAAAMLERGHILATDYANAQVEQGTSFRDAYSQVADLVETADKEGCQFQELLTDSRPLTFEDSVEQRRLPGGTARQRVMEAIDALRSDHLH